MHDIQKTPEMVRAFRCKRRCEILPPVEVQNNPAVRAAQWTQIGAVLQQDSQLRGVLREFKSGNRA
jgi:hypothetical protein